MEAPTSMDEESLKTKHIVDLSDPKAAIAEVDLDFDEIAKVMQHSEIQMAMPTRGIGRKHFIQIRSQENSVAVEFFSEAIVYKAPKSRELGYTSSDVETFSGVAFHFPFDKDDTQKTCGTIVSYKDFLETYIPDKEGSTTTRIILDRIMEGMEAASAVNDKFLTQVNNLWSERPTGVSSLFNNKPH